MTASSDHYSPERHLERALQQIEHGDSAGALETLRTVLSQEPDHAGAHALLAVCLLNLKRLGAAQHEAKTALSLAPELPLAHYASGMIALARQDTDSAEDAFRRAIELNPDHHASLLGLARARWLIGDYPGALSWVETALERAPEASDAMALKGMILFERGDLEPAEGAANQALQTEPENIGACLLMGNLHFARGEIDEARALAAVALSQAPDEPDAIELMVKIRSRKHPLLRLWWRYSNWMQRRGRHGQILLLVIAYITLQVAVTAHSQGHVGHWIWIIVLVWLFAVVFSWVAPARVRRGVEKELSTITLKTEY